MWLGFASCYSLVIVVVVGLFRVKLEPPGWSNLRGGAGGIFVKLGGSLVINNMCIMLLVDFAHLDG